MIKAEKISLVEIKKLKPHPKNPNQHSPAQIDRLMRIIEYQGFRNPIIVSNLSGKVIAGHGRIEAAKKLGLKQIPVIYQDFDNETQEYAALSSDNAIQDWSHLDLSMINEEIGDLGPDFDIDLLGIDGFTIEPADKRIERVNKGDENSEWVGLPEFSPSGEKYINLVFQFKTEKAREKYVSDNKIKVNFRKSNQWIVKK